METAGPSKARRWRRKRRSGWARWSSRARPRRGGASVRPGKFSGTEGSPCAETGDVSRGSFASTLERSCTAWEEFKYYYSCVEARHPNVWSENSYCVHKIRTSCCSGKDIRRVGICVYAGDERRVKSHQLVTAKLKKAKEYKNFPSFICSTNFIYYF